MKVCLRSIHRHAKATPEPPHPVMSCKSAPCWFIIELRTWNTSTCRTRIRTHTGILCAQPPKEGDAFIFIEKIIKIGPQKKKFSYTNKEDPDTTSIYRQISQFILLCAAPFNPLALNEPPCNYRVSCNYHFVLVFDNN